MKGGNSEELYKGTGRLVMARSLEKNWPDIVKTTWKFKRPQHSVNWGVFKTPLKRIVEIKDLKPNEYGLKLVKLKEIKSERVKQLFNDYGKSEK